MSIAKQAGVLSSAARGAADGASKGALAGTVLGTTVVPATFYIKERRRGAPHTSAREEATMAGAMGTGLAIPGAALGTVAGGIKGAVKGYKEKKKQKDQEKKASVLSYIKTAQSTGSDLQQSTQGMGLMRSGTDAVSNFNWGGPKIVRKKLPSTGKGFKVKM